MRQPKARDFWRYRDPFDASGAGDWGCRVSTYACAEEAIADALRLSRGMSYKNAMTLLPAGGGKAVLDRVPEGSGRNIMFDEFADVVQSPGGANVTAEDVGTSAADMLTIAKRTRFVSGLPQAGVRACGDPSPWTALGVFEAMKVALQRPLAGARVAVQGVGAVGWRLCELLHRAGARLVVADVNAEKALAAREKFGAERRPVDLIHRVDADVFSPNARGGALNREVIGDLQAPVVCGGAKNQLGAAEDGDRLAPKGVVYAPDYVVNDGGIINVVAEYTGEAVAHVEHRVLEIGPRLKTLFDQAHALKMLPHVLADEMAQDCIGRTRDARGAL